MKKLLVRLSLILVLVSLTACKRSTETKIESKSTAKSETKTTTKKDEEKSELNGVWIPKQVYVGEADEIMDSSNTYVYEKDEDGDYVYEYKFDKMQMEYCIRIKNGKISEYNNSEVKGVFTNKDLDKLIEKNSGYTDPEFKDKSKINESFSKFDEKIDAISDLYLASQDMENRENGRMFVDFWCFKFTNDKKLIGTNYDDSLTYDYNLDTILFEKVE